jgi:hypothetical protein
MKKVEMKGKQNRTSVCEREDPGCCNSKCNGREKRWVWGNKTLVVRGLLEGEKNKVVPILRFWTSEKGNENENKRGGVTKQWAGDESEKKKSVWIGCIQTMVKSCGLWVIGCLILIGQSTYYLRISY